MVAPAVGDTGNCILCCLDASLDICFETGIGLGVNDVFQEDGRVTIATATDHTVFGANVFHGVGDEIQEALFHDEYATGEWYTSELVT